MHLNPALFWDTDPLKLDYERHARYIMTRVVMYGNLDEWKQVMAFYGKQRIADELTQERELDIKTVHFLSLILDVPLENFISYGVKNSSFRYFS